VNLTLAVEALEQSHQGLVRSLLVNADPDDDHDVRGWLRSEQEVKPLEAVRVRPVGVVEDEEEPAGHGADGTQERLEEPQPLPSVRHRQGGGHLRARIEELREETGDLGQPDRLE
jgi:hypothetical protein